MLLPDFTSFDPGYDKSDKKGKRNADRRLLQPAVQLARPLPPSFILPRMRGRIKEGAARLSAFHRGSRWGSIPSPSCDFRPGFLGRGKNADL